MKQRISPAKLRALWLGVCACLATLWLGLFPLSGVSNPIEVNLARSPWNTSSLQVEIARQLLEELGYKVNLSQVFEPNDFYAALARGETDLWLETWPDHDAAIDAANGLEDGEAIALAAPIADVAIQGYRIDRATAEKLDIASLADLRDPQVAAAFDLDGNGKADLIGCNDGWVCAETIDRHIEAYELGETVEQVSQNYDYQIRQTLDRYERGEPV